MPTQSFSYNEKLIQAWQKIELKTSDLSRKINNTNCAGPEQKACDAALKSLLDMSKQTWPKDLENTYIAKLNWISQWISNQKPEQESYYTAEAINNYYLALDPFHYILPTAYDQEESNSSSIGNFIGVGVDLDEVNGEVIITNTLLNSPARRAELQVGDKIIAVNGKTASAIKIDGVLTELRGNLNEEVSLKIQREAQTIDLVLKRELVENPNVEGNVLNKKIGYIRFYSFMKNSVCHEVEGLLRQQLKEGAESFVLDLRSNGGGQIDQAQCIAGLFLGDRHHMYTMMDIKTKEPIYAGVTQRLYEFDQPLSAPITTKPLVVLIDAGTASASEFLTAALQDYKRAIVVGMRSTGKGTFLSVNTNWRWDGKSISNVTEIETSEIGLRKTGYHIHTIGITPDIAVGRTSDLQSEDKSAKRIRELFPDYYPIKVTKEYQTQFPELIPALQQWVSKAQERAPKAFDRQKDYAVLSAQYLLEINNPLETPSPVIAPPSSKKPTSKSKTIKEKKESFKNKDCAKNSTCDLKSINYHSRDWRIEVLGAPSFGSSIRAEYETDNYENLKNYGFVQFIKGCVFLSRKSENKIERLILKRKLLHKQVPFRSKEWIVDTGDDDPLFQNWMNWLPSSAKDYIRQNSYEKFYELADLNRHFFYAWNTVAGSIEKASEKLFGLAVPPKPKLYVSHYPGTVSQQKRPDATNYSLKYKMCLFKLSDIPKKISSEKDLSFEQALHCFDWDSSFIYNHETDKYYSQNEIHPSCSVDVDSETWF